MRYAIAIALFALPFYLILSAMPANAATPQRVCGLYSVVAGTAATAYQNSVGIREFKQISLKQLSSGDGRIDKFESNLIDYSITILVGLYSGEIPMMQVGSFAPNDARRIVDNFEHVVYAGCIAKHQRG